jgi:hypothetical protein
VRIRRGEHGTGQIVVTLSDLEIEEVAAALQAFIDLRYRPRPVDESSRGDPTGPADDGGPVDESSRGDCGRSFSFLDGTPVHPADAAAATCDCSTVAHTVTAAGEPLNLGRKTRQWSTAQRRAISVRDGGQCRFPGCRYRHFDIHHLVPWEADGPTDITNGCCACRRHHRMIHGGYRVAGDPNGPLNFYRPDGTYIGATFPAPARTRCSWVHSPVRAGDAR